ncbi:MAG: TusE/DsrC/DsvC family sulfur relay protein [Pseudomonadales bacterium]|nr:TusE/DsrC/DsvC family sulfur relay protein [Pseudomonadales bacterium]
MGLNVNKIENEGRSISLDKEGYLVSLSDWNQNIANALALKEGITLTKAHWEIIFLMRDFHDKFEHAPAMRILVKAVKMQLGEEKGNSIYLLTLFPDSPAKRAAKIAGLPRPTNCL